MKTQYLILSLIGIGILSYIIYYKTSEPIFYIQSGDNIKKEGFFNFSGKEYFYSKDKSGNFSGKNNYSLVLRNDGNLIFFDLYKNGIFVRNLKTI